MIGLAGNKSSVNPWLAHAVRIKAITPEIPSVATYHLEFVAPEVGEGYSCRPGQFNMLYLPGVGEAAISVSGRNAGGDAWLHTIRTAGNVTGELERVGVGGQIGLRGPFGTSWPVDDCRGRDVILLAGGIGLPPLRPVIDAILTDRAAFSRTTLIYGARSPDTLLYTRQFADWKGRGIEVLTTVDRAAPGWQGHVGVVPLVLDRLRLPSPENTIVMTCGPEVMMRYAIRSALNLGVPQTQIWLSLERNMQCAVGFCGHCQLGPAFICKDGPVFRHDRIAPFLGREDL